MLSNQNPEGNELDRHDKQSIAQDRTGNDAAADKDQSGSLDCTGEVTLRRRWHAATKYQEILGGNLNVSIESMPHTVYSSRMIHVMLNCSQPVRAFGVLQLYEGIVDGDDLNVGSFDSGRRVSAI
jgi:hypothetical protein